MNLITTVTTKGQVTIPVSIRQALGIEIGDKVAFSRILPEAGETVIKVIPGNIVEDLYGSLSSEIKENNYQKARNKAGKMLLDKYKIKK